jgi:16S rRNA (cytosine967-C5)-methyltransferase
MTARDLATTRIAHQTKRFPDLDLHAADPRGAAELDARDAALASAIEHATLRRWLTLVAIIQTQLARPWEEVEPRLQAALLSGAAQLLLLDRLPDYAVIDEMVEWAKENVRAKAGGMVNAVLRKVAGLRGEMRDNRGHDPASWTARDLPLHDGRVCEMKIDVFAENSLQRLSQQTSHPAQMLEHWLGLFGHEHMLRLAAHSVIQPPVILHGLRAQDASRDARLIAHTEEGFFVLDTQGQTSLADVLTQHRDAIVQDPAAAAPAAAVAALAAAPSLIIDACAGKGTKTRQLARLFPQAQIIATDIDHTRLMTLKTAFRDRPGDDDRVRVVDHDRLMDYAGRADLVVLDVPCSNTGVLARRVEAKYRFTRPSLRKLVDLQRQIVADALRLLQTRTGQLLYATCSIDPAENQQQSQWVTQWHPLLVHKDQARQPQGLPGEPLTQYSDGGYWALFARRAG